ncbi:MAG: MATE family efflux transporter [Clostridiales bacterium]|nr:MATE family efflux transporter [Clostridiales bacterium]
MALTQKRELILTGNLYKVILTLSAPIMLNNLIQTFYNLTDTYFISRLGSTEVAAIQFIWPLIFIIISLGNGLSMGASSIISQYIGSNQYDEASKVSGQLLYYSLITSIIIGAFGYIGAPYFIRMMGATGDLLKYASEYLKIILLGSFSQFILFAFIAIKQGQGDTKTPMKLSVMAVITNIILDPIFMFVFGLGIQGAAIATILSRTIFAFYGLYFLIYKDDGIKIDFNHFKLNRNIIIKISQIGMPTALGQATTAFGFAILNIFIISFGEKILTAFAIGNQISSLVFLPAMGIGSAISTIIGQNLGADNIQRAKKTAYKSMLLTTVITTITGFILLFFTQSLMRIFTNDPEIIFHGVAYMNLLFMTLPLMGYYQVLIGVFIGSGHTYQSMFMMIGRLWLLRIPLILIFKHYSNIGPSSIWYAMIISNFIIVIIGYIMFLNGNWQRKIIQSKKIVLEN